jgi:hypothetical protein
MVGIAIGRRIDDDLDAFGRVQLTVVDAVLRANIGRWFGGELALRQGIEFCAVIAGKKDVVVSQVKPVCVYSAEKCHC